MSSISNLLLDPKWVRPVSYGLLIFELIANVAIIWLVPYTKIDWDAYMQEVDGVWHPTNGTFDYSRLKGDTGPLVYPAVFIWTFSAIQWITTGHIRAAQYVFLAIYLANLSLVHRLLRRCKIQPYLLVMMSLTSYRIHSVYVLRLFNDPVAMLFLYAALNMFVVDRRWTIGSVCFSLAVGVKMNILLFAPALMAVYLSHLGVQATVLQLLVCAAIQLVTALPFLASYPVAYVARAFDFGRIFDFKWTVNWRFIGPTIFYARPFHMCLLVCHLAVVLFLLSRWLLQRSFSAQSSMTVVTMFVVSNLAGIAFARSLHYQFYVWYYHQLPIIMTVATDVHWLRILLWLAIELCWNVYPSSLASSLTLQSLHLGLLFVLVYKTEHPPSKQE